MGRINGFFTEFWCCEGEVKNEICITIALKGGVVKSLYQNKNTEEVVEINPAAGSVFMHVLEHRSKIQHITGLKCKVGKNGIYFSVTAEKEKIEENLENVIRLIFEQQVTEEEFVEAKQQTIDKLKQNFKNEMTRNWYYMLEFTEMGKKYVYNKWARALETIQYDEFNKYTEVLVNPENSIVIVNGMLEETEITSICAVLKCIQKKGIEYLDYGYAFGENKILDWHLVKNMSCSSLGALYFVFPDENVTPTEKMFLLLYISEILFQEHGIVSADAFDVCIVYFQESIERYELEIADIWTEENVIGARERLLQRFENLIKNLGKFGVYAGELLFSGVDISKLIRYIQICDFDIIYRAYKNSNVKIGNGAIINEGGRKDGRRTGTKTK